MNRYQLSSLLATFDNLHKSVAFHPSWRGTKRDSPIHRSSAQCSSSCSQTCFRVSCRITGTCRYVFCWDERAPGLKLMQCSVSPISPRRPDYISQFFCNIRLAANLTSSFSTSEMSIWNSWKSLIQASQLLFVRASLLLYGLGFQGLHEI